MIHLTTKESEYVRTIVIAAANGTVCKDGLETIRYMMRGYTLEAAKAHVKELEEMKSHSAKS